MLSLPYIESVVCRLTLFFFSKAGNKNSGKKVACIPVKKAIELQVQFLLKKSFFSHRLWKWPWCSNTTRSLIARFQKADELTQLYYQCHIDSHVYHRSQIRLCLPLDRFFWSYMPFIEFLCCLWSLNCIATELYSIKNKEVREDFFIKFLTFEISPIRCFFLFSFYFSFLFDFY